MLPAVSGLSEIARLQAMAGTLPAEIPSESMVAALAEITAGATPDATADIAIANPMSPFPELFMPELTADEEITHDLWHPESELAPLDFGAIV